MRQTLGLWLAATLVIGGLAANSGPVEAQATAEQWRMVELSFNSTRAYTNPFLDVQVSAVFTSPSGATLTRPGFWDGGDTWKVRVALTEVGRWTYQVTASDASNTGLNPPPGEIECVAYSGDLPIFRHGFLRAAPSGRYLEHADGSPFFWLADTHWFFAQDERWDESNSPNYASEFRGMVDKRVAQEFTVYQSVIFGPSPVYWKPNLVGQTIEPAYFREQLDRKMQYLADQGLVNAFGIGFHENIDGNVTTLSRLANYIVARYGAYPMVWITGGEVQGYDASLRQSRVDGWRQVALAFDQWDTYDQPQSAHYVTDFPMDYQGEDWFDFTMLQGGHLGLVESQTYYGFYFGYPTTPLLEAEAQFEGYLSADAARVRQAAYRAIQAGSFGYSYGAQGVWNAAWDETSTRFDAQRHYNWYEGLELPGAAQLTYLARFYRSLPWEQLIPQPEGWGSWTLDLHDTDMPLVKADRDANDVVVYFPANYDPPLASGLLFNLQPRTYMVRWYNPRTGQWLALGAARLGLDEWRVEPKPDGEDWLLWLHAAAAPDTRRGLPPLRARTNLARTGIFRASSEASLTQDAASAFDGDAQTSWRPVDDRPFETHWLEVDFGDTVRLNTVVLTELDHRTRGYQLYVWRGEGWMLVAQGRLIGHQEPRIVRFPTVAGSRLRVAFTSGVLSPVISEIEVYFEPHRGCGLNPALAAPGWADYHQCPN